MPDLKISRFRESCHCDCRGVGHPRYRSNPLVIEDSILGRLLFDILTIEAPVVEVILLKTLMKFTVVSIHCKNDIVGLIDGCLDRKVAS